MGGHYHGADIWDYETETLLINIAQFAVDSAE